MSAYVEHKVHSALFKELLTPWRYGTVSPDVDPKPMHRALRVNE